jgi:hypothetical protein
MSQILSKTRGLTLVQSAGLAVSLSFLFVVAYTQAAVAQAQDYTDVTSGAAAEITAALPVALTVVGLFVGVMLAYKLLRRVIRA